MASIINPLGGAPSLPRLNVVSVALFVTALAIGAAWSIATVNPVPFIVLTLAGVVAMQSPRVAQQWERAIVLRLGRFQGMRGPLMRIL